MFLKLSRLGLFIFLTVCLVTGSSATAAQLEILQFREVRMDNAPALRLRFSQLVSLSQVQQNALLTEFKEQANLGESFDSNSLRDSSVYYPNNNHSRLKYLTW